MKYSLFLAVTLCIGAMASSCGPRYALQESKDIEGVWTYADSAVFEMDLTDTSKLYAIAIALQHTTDYAFQNLYLRIHTQFPSGERLSQPISLELAGKAGNWLGKCRGEGCKIVIPIQENAFFNATGTHRFVLEQYMRSDSLPGIRSIGLHIYETGPRK